MAIEDKKKGTTPADRRAQIDAANKKTAAKVAKIRAEAAAKKRTDTAKKRIISSAAKKRVSASTAGIPGLSGVKAKAASAGGVFMSGALRAKASIIAEHTVKKGDTLSAIAKKYYGSGAKPYYELIQKANKDIIKDVNLIYPDQVFKIPVLPPELKK